MRVIIFALDYTHYPILRWLPESCSSKRWATEVGTGEENPVNYVLFWRTIVRPSLPAFHQRKELSTFWWQEGESESYWALKMLYFAGFN